MGTRHLSLLEQKKMQWAKEREELAALCAPWGAAENARPLRKRLEPNLPEEPEEESQRRTYDNSASPLTKESPIEDHSINVTYISPDERGRPMQREINEGDSRSPSLPPVNLNVQEDPRRRTYYRGREMVGARPEVYEGYLYINDNHNLSKSAENFCSNDSERLTKRKAFLSGDHLGDSSSMDKISADISPFSSTYQLRNSNLSIATDGDSSWREWGNVRGMGDEPRPRWGDRGIHVGPPWNSGGPPPMSRSGDNLAPAENYPTPGWVERGLSRMSGDGRGRGGSAEYQRCDPGIRVVISDEMGGIQRVRGSMNELQNLGYAPGSGMNEMSPQRNFDGHSNSVPYTGEMPNIHSSFGTPQRTGSTIEGNRGERVISVGHDVYNVNEVPRNGRQYGCISAPNKANGYSFKKNDDVTSSLPNLQCSNSHLRGQNVPVDPDVIVERELRRLKAMELQKAIRQQLEEREKKRIQEKEQRLTEERALEERSRKQQEEERKKKEEEEKKLREKEELEKKKDEMMREALEAAEQDAQKQRKKRSLRQHEMNAHEEDVNKAQSDIINQPKADDQMSNYIVSPCCPVITEGSPSIISQPVQATLDHVDYGLSPNYAADGGMTSHSRSSSVYEGTMAYHPSNTPVAPFKITLPDASGGAGHEAGEAADHKQGGVLIVGRDVYLLPYVNTEVLAPKLMNGSTYSLGGFDNVGSRMFNDHCDYRREWIGGTTRIKTTKDVSTQTDPCSQGPLLLLLRMAEPEEGQNGYELRSSTDDSSIPECECRESEERAFSADAGNSYSDCCFCHRTRSQSQPSCSKASGMDAPTKRQQQVDPRPKWGANRPNCKYTTQSEKDPHYSCRNGGPKRSSQGKSKRDTSEVANAEEGSEDLDQPSKSNTKSRTKNEIAPGNSNPSGGSGPSRSPTPRKKRHTGKKSSKKAAEAKKSDHQKAVQISQSPLPVLVPPRKDAPRRVQIVKPSLSLDQDSNGYTEHLYSDSSANRTQLTFLPPSQLSPSALQSDMKHLFPPVLPVLQQGHLSPIRITQSPMPPVRISSPLPSSRLSATPMPPIMASQSPIPSSRQTPAPTSPSPPLQKPPKSNRHCGSPPVPAVLAKMRREQKSPPRQFSFISSAPDKEEKVVPSRKESRSGTPSMKTPTPGPVVSTSRPGSKNAIILVSPKEEGSALMIRKPGLSPTDIENNTLLVTPRDDISVSPVLNISSRSSPGADVSNALMLVTLSEDISIGSPSPNPLSSILEVDDKSSYLLVTPSDEISVGLDSRSNFSVSRASQVSAELMPDGFWEDFSTSAKMLTPYPEANSVVSTIEEHSSIAKPEEINPDNILPGDIVRTDENTGNFHESNDINEAEEDKDDILETKHEQSKEEIKTDLQESKNKANDEEIVLESHILNDQKTYEESDTVAAAIPLEETAVKVDCYLQKPDDLTTEHSDHLPSVKDLKITESKPITETDSQADIEEPKSKVDSEDVQETNKRDSDKCLSEKELDNKTEETKNEKKGGSLLLESGEKELLEVVVKLGHDTKEDQQEKEVPSKEVKEDKNGTEYLDEEAKKEKK